MKDKILWFILEKRNALEAYIRYRQFQLIKFFTGKEYWSSPKKVAGKRLLSTQQSNQLIGNAIEQGTPFWAGRFGGTEMNVIYQYLLHQHTPKVNHEKDAIEKLCHYSGFFPNDVAFGKEFVALMLDTCPQLDLQGMWGRYMEDYIYLAYQKNTKLTHLCRIEPWQMYRYQNSGIKPWSSKLKGKKVLVIHPFVQSIRKQYEKKRTVLFERIYEADDILPEFELLTIQAVQTLAGETDPRFATWFEALEWMKEECNKLEFDVAIIGCGAYGFPLAAHVKSMGKVAIHLAGVTQILFGILGERWERDCPEFCRDVVNEHWVRPMESEKIKNAKSIEENCYW